MSTFDPTTDRPRAEFCDRRTIFSVAAAFGVLAAIPGRAFSQTVHFLKVDVSVVGKGIPVSKLTGQSVVNDKNETIGKIDDVVIGDDSATFSFAHQRVGLCPDGGLSYLLPRAVGQRHARTLLLTAAKVGADDALRLRLLTHKVPATNLDNQSLDMARQLSRGPGLAMRTAKALVEASLDQSFELQLKAEAAGVVACVGSPDFAEGVTAFMQKRAPDFAGPDRRP